MPTCSKMTLSSKLLWNHPAFFIENSPGLVFLLSFVIRLFLDSEIIWRGKLMWLPRRKYMDVCYITWPICFSWNTIKSLTDNCIPVRARLQLFLTKFDVISIQETYIHVLMESFIIKSSTRLTQIMVFLTCSLIL